MTTTTCATCRWWQRNGECRRMPPTGTEQSSYAVYNQNAATFHGLSRGVWPVTAPTDWCGEHAPKAER